MKRYYTPARNLHTGAHYNGMERITIAWHGYNVFAAPRNVSPGTPLVGRNNIGFAGDRVEAVRLKGLWNLHWHKGWKTPATRPK